MSTTGDKILDTALSKVTTSTPKSCSPARLPFPLREAFLDSIVAWQIGEKSLFTKELELALEKDE